MDELIELLEMAIPTIIIFGKLLFDNKKKSKKELESKKLFEDEKTKQDKEHAAINNQLSNLILKISAVEITNSRIENDVKEMAILTKNIEFSRKLKAKLKSHLDYMSLDLSKRKKDILNTAFVQGFKVFQYIFDEDFEDIKKELIFEKFNEASSFVQNTMNISELKYKAKEDDITAVFRAFAAKTESMSEIQTNGQRRQSFNDESLNFVDEVVAICSK